MAGKVLNIKVCSPLKLRNGLTGNYHAICHYSYNLPLPTSLKKTVPMKICCIEIEKKKENATAQKQECGCPSLQPSLRNHTHAFFYQRTRFVDN